MDSPGAILTRLQALSGYEWDTELPPFHSSYDNWHFLGKKTIEYQDPAPSHPPLIPSVQSPPPRSAPSRHQSEVRPPIGGHRYSSSDSISASQCSESTRIITVVARVSRHVLRLEREYQLCRQIWKHEDENRDYFVKPIDLVKVTPRNGEEPMAICIVEAPNRNYLKELAPFGPTAYSGFVSKSSWHPLDGPNEKLSLRLFLDFSIGAAKCLAILHHQHRLVHGEIRGDAFHFNQETGLVKMINFGSGARSFENGLTSAGWYSLSREFGIEHKLAFIAPEQTGRLPAQPDGRTDVYSLGILFWSMLTDEPPFQGDTPLAIMQNVLSRRIPPVSTKRIDIPEPLSAVIAKMTEKNIDKRYNSISGVAHDLMQIKTMLEQGDMVSLEDFKIATKDVSSYFNLPNSQIGRKAEQKEILRIMEQFWSRRTHISRTDTRSRYANTVPADMRDAASEENISDGSMRGSVSRSSGHANSNPEEQAATVRSNDTNGNLSGNLSGHKSSSHTNSSNILPSVPSLRNQILDVDSGIPSPTSPPTIASNSLDSSTSLLRQPSIPSRKNKGQSCELITISGSAGMGKSCMVQSISNAARSHGYYAAAKFDQARKAPFAPVLKLLSSLFRQIFSEADVNTEFHNHIRAQVQPVWGVLHNFLGLPQWLLNSSLEENSESNVSTPLAIPAGKMKRRTSGSSTNSVVSGNVAADWLRSGGSTKASRFTNLFVGVLHIIGAKKFVCFCIDDIQFADHESLDLLHKMVSNKVPILLIMTNRPEDQLSKKAKSLITRATKIELKPFTEEETAEYVSQTIHRDHSYVLPLVAVIQEKTAGNPFFIREMMETCYRTECLFYSWTVSAWEFDLDRIFTEFVSDTYGTRINNDFVTRRLQEMSSTTRALLSWASLIGSSFSFAFIKVLMEGSATGTLENVPTTGPKDPVVGLQNAVNAYIVMAADNEDRFRFAHDRYMQSAMALTEQYDKAEMHYAIVKTIFHPRFKDMPWAEEMDVHQKCRYIAMAQDILREREPERMVYRQVLFEAAENALESGARATAISYLTQAMALLQDDPWNESCSDSCYQESLKLHMKAAENNWYQNNFDDAMDLVKVVFEHAKSAHDMAPCWIIESRIYVRQGNNAEAFACLKRALAKFGVSFPDASFEDCDREFWELHPTLVNLNTDKVLERADTIDPTMEVLGVLLTELSSAAFWSSQLLFFQATTAMVRIHLERGVYPQVGLAYLQIGVIMVGRFGLTKLGCDMGDLSIALFDVYHDDSFVVGRGLTLHALFFGHLQGRMPSQFPQLVQAYEASLTAGDRIFALLNLGVNASFRVWTSQDVSETEQFTVDAPMDLQNSDADLRGGIFIMAVRQYTRALQGKTNVRSADGIFDDDQHNSLEYEKYITNNANPHDRQLTVYGGYKQIALYRFGYINASIEQGERIIRMADSWFSSRFVFENLFFLILSYCRTIQETPSHPQRQAMLDKIAQYQKRLESAAEANDINFKAWLLILKAEQANIVGDLHDAVVAYEEALDHCQSHDLAMDEALILELYAEKFVRRGARRPARQLLQECLAVYRRVGASGKVDHLTERHASILQLPKPLGTAEMATQTDIINTDNTAYRLQKNEEQEMRLGMETSADRTKAWVSPEYVNGNLGEEQVREQSHGNDNINREVSAMGLDMIDLASILESNQVLSSELQIDKLMGKMAEIITEISAADLVGIVIKDDKREFVVSALGTPDGVETFPEGIAMETDIVERQVALQVTKYVLRFREVIFVHNLFDDDRFSMVSPTYMEKNPGGKAVISLPIIRGNDELLGVIYVEGQPNKFTERNLTVLRLLVNQISISLANALVMKRIEKVSAENAAMVGLQRKAVSMARQAELKAKEAQKEAEHNMRLKEEAAKAKSMFLANVSHELRTPLNGVIGMSELLKGTILTVRQTEYADSIRICADHLLSVINDLLDFTKLDAGKMTVSKVPLNISKTIREVVRALSFQNNQKGLKTEIVFEIDPELLIIGDPVRLHQIMMNLLSNSYKFTFKGGITIKVVPAVEDDTNISITVTVTDTGIGIPLAQREKLFQPFSQAESNSSRSFQGTGLGLSICKALVEQLMGGTIWLDSIPDQGTTVGFTISFPKATEEERAAAQAVMISPAISPQPRVTPAETKKSDSPALVDSSTPPPPPSPGSYFADISEVPRNELRICIAEDNLINQKIAISFVQKLGYSCDAFINGRKAVDALEAAALKGTPYHIVLMDVQMPVLDGYDATREIRRHRDQRVREVLVIAMTASAIQGDREKCLDAGMNDYLAKPVKPATLKNLLDSYLDLTKRIVDGMGDSDKDMTPTIESETRGKDGLVDHTKPNNMATAQS